MHPAHEDVRPQQPVSAPFVNNLSLFIDAEPHSYLDRDAINFPGPGRSPRE